MKSKKHYVAPECVTFEIETNPYMIDIGSGDTSPEESDANVTLFEEDNNYSDHPSSNLWDD